MFEDESVEYSDLTNTEYCVDVIEVSSFDQYGNAYEGESFFKIILN